MSDFDQWLSTAAVATQEPPPVTPSPSDPVPVDAGLDRWLQSTTVAPPATHTVRTAVPFGGAMMFNETQVEDRNIDTIPKAMLYAESNPDAHAMRAIRYWGKRIPFGEVVGAAEMVALRSAVKRIKTGEGINEDYVTVGDYLVSAEQSQNKGAMRKIFDIASSIPGFATEFALTGGAYNLTKAGAAKGMAWGMGKTAETMAGKVATAVVPRALGVTAQAALNPMMIAQSVTERMVPQFALKTDEAGTIQDILVKDDPSFATALLKGFGDVVIEVGSERGGKVLDWMAPGLARLPGAQRLSAIKAAIIGRFLGKGKTVESLNKMLKAGGWNGVLGEVLEERMGEVARGATGIEQGYGTTGKVFTAPQSALYDLLIEGGAFLVPMAGQAGLSFIDKSAARTKETTLEITPADVQSQIDKLVSAKAKGWITVEEGKVLGLPEEELKNRAARMAAVDARIQQLAQETENAQPVEEAAQADVGGGPRVAPEVLQGAEPAGGQGVRPGGQVAGEVSGEETQAEVPVAAPEAASEAERFFSPDQMTDAEVKTTAARMKLKATDRAGVIAEVQSHPKWMKFIKENLPPEATAAPQTPPVAPEAPVAAPEPLVTPQQPGPPVEPAKGAEQLQKDLEAAAPGSKVDVTEGGVRVTLPGGAVVEGLLTPPIDPNAETAAKDYGITETQVQKRRVAGATVTPGTTVRFKDGTTKTFDEVTMLYDPAVADKSTAFHEMHHVAKDIGFYATRTGKRIYSSLMKRFGTDEKIAQAREVWVGPKGLAAKIRAYVQSILDPIKRALGKGMHPELAMGKTFGKKFWAQETAESPRRTIDRSGRVVGEAALSRDQSTIPPDSPYATPHYQLKRVIREVTPIRGEGTEKRVFVVSFDAKIAAKLKDGKARRGPLTLKQAREINSSPERIKDWAKIYKAAPTYSAASDMVKAPATGGKLVGVEVLTLTKGCERARTTVERVENGVLPNETRIEACYGSKCWVNSTIPVLFKSKENMEVRELSFADPAAFEKFLTPARVARFNKAKFLREGYSGDSSHLIASGNALKWLQACRKAGVKKKTVLISAGYGPVTNQQYAELAEYNDIVEVHFSLSGWFHANEIMERLGEYQAAKDAGVNAHIRLITNENEVAGVKMANDDLLKKQFQKMGIAQEDVLETPFHNDDLPATVREKRPELWRSDPSGDWSNICCETHACKSCLRKCMTAKVETKPTISYQLKDEPSYQLTPGESDIDAFKALWKNVGQASMEDVIRAGEVLDSMKGAQLKALAIELGQPAAAKFGVGELRKFLQSSLRERVGDRRRFEDRGPSYQLKEEHQFILDTIDSVAADEESHWGPDTVFISDVIASSGLSRDAAIQVLTDMRAKQLISFSQVDLVESGTPAQRARCRVAEFRTRERSTT